MSGLLIALGGALGAWARFQIGAALSERIRHFPLAMVVVNLLGAFGLGIFMGGYVMTLTEQPSFDGLYQFLVLGFFGAFTTFSTFSIEAIDLLKAKKFTEASAYIIGTAAGSMLLFALGVLFMSL
ncbi:fluoride efflux transporter CrcB [Bacillus tianshenii]|nr:fluoride efflux transporter CrcB [Bacillus tianshenii]